MRAIAEDGCGLHVECDGPADGPPVILANSLAATLDMWAAQAAALQKAGYRVIRFDARGHGRSDVPADPYSLDQLGGDALAVLDACSVEHAAWCGLSLGGLTGLWLAVHAPGRLVSLCVANSAPAFPPPLMWRDRAAQALRDGMAGIAAATVERWLTPAFRARDPDSTERIRRMIAATLPVGYAGCCTALEGADLTERLAEICVPTLVIGGMHDPSTPTETAEHLALAIPGARLTLLDAAHLSNVEAEAAFTAALLDHLDTPGGSP